jgi:hypothetical protein
MQWGTPKERETRRRIKLCVWAYAYEFHDSVVPDYLFDVEAYQVDLSVHTDRLDLDFWFIAEFIPDSGMWIHKHPELDKIKQLYESWYENDT